MLIILLSVFWMCNLQNVNAFPSGAGGCAGGMAAVSGYHLDTAGGRPVISGSLFKGAITVQIGSTVLNGTMLVGDFPIGQDLPLSIDASSVEYKGVLVRLEAPTGVNTATTLLPGTNTKMAPVCMDPIIGITHTNNNTKSTSTGTIRFDEEVLNVVLDITVVFQNDAEFSIYAYSRVTANFRDLSTPVMTPVEATVPTAVPVPQTTPSPVTLDPAATLDPTVISSFPISVAVPSLEPTPTFVPTPVDGGMGGMGGVMMEGGMGGMGGPVMMEGGMGGGIMMEGGMGGGVMMEGGAGGMGGGVKMEVGMGGGAKKDGMGGMGVGGGMVLMGMGKKA
jgi:hypothetical protein